MFTRTLANMTLPCYTSYFIKFPLHDALSFKSWNIVYSQYVFITCHETELSYNLFTAYYKADSKEPRLKSLQGKFSNVHIPLEWNTQDDRIVEKDPSFLMWALYKLLTRYQLCFLINMKCFQIDI